MRLADKVQDWLNYLEWEDKIHLNEEEQTSRVSFTYGIKDQGFDVYVETEEKKDYLKVYIYAPFNALSTKYIDCAVLFNRINYRRFSGSITLTDNGRIRWQHVVDFEEIDPSVIAIENAFNSGVGLFDFWFDEISEIALTKTTAQELFDRLDAEAEATEAESSEVDVPDSI